MARARVKLVPVLLAVLFGVAGLWFGHKYQSSRPTAAPMVIAPATILPQPRALPDFALLDHRGERFTRQRLTGAWSFLFFGYTHCPDVCPSTLAVLGMVEADIARTLRQTDVQVVFVSVDPERDTVAQLAAYVPYFNKDFIGLTGDQAQIDILARQFGVLHVKAPQAGASQDYLVDHSVAIMLVSPKAEWYAVFSAPHEPAAIARAFIQIRDLFQR